MTVKCKMVSPFHVLCEKQTNYLKSCKKEELAKMLNIQTMSTSSPRFSHLAPLHLHSPLGRLPPSLCNPSTPLCIQNCCVGVCLNLSTTRKASIQQEARCNFQRASMKIKTTSTWKDKCGRDGTKYSLQRMRKDCLSMANTQRQGFLVSYWNTKEMGSGKITRHPLSHKVSCGHDSKNNNKEFRIMKQL